MNAIGTHKGMPRFAVFGSTALTVVGGGIFLFGAAGEPQRIWANLLAASYGVLGIGLGAAVWLALFNVTGARWSEGIRPVAERLSLLLPVGAVGVAVVLLAVPSLYPWMHEVGEASPFQALWLSRPFFLLRSFIYLAVWFGLSFLLVRASRRRDESRVWISAAFLVVFAITFWLASVDWIMSLEPKWSSTVFGIYHFSGLILASLAAIMIGAICLERRGTLTNRNLGDLGTLLFSFSSFWAYIWFCQFMLIWYVNIREETDYFARRQQEAWQPIFFANVILNWGVPFVVLLFRRAKETPAVLVFVATIILVGHGLDLYLMVIPPVVAGGPMIADAGLFAAAIGSAALFMAIPFSLEANMVKL